MPEPWEIIPLSSGREELLAALHRGNALSARYGLVLNRADMVMLADHQKEALRDTGRVELGRGPYEKLIYALCDSPYVTQAGYAALLAALCDLFYRFKGESGEQWSDDELIKRMAELFEDCKGAVELVGDCLWQALHEEPETGEEDVFERQPDEED